MNWTRARSASARTAGLGQRDGLEVACVGGERIAVTVGGLAELERGVGGLGVCAGARSPPE